MTVKQYIGNTFSLSGRLKAFITRPVYNHEQRIGRIRGLYHQLLDYVSMGSGDSNRSYASSLKPFERDILSGKILNEPYQKDLFLEQAEALEIQVMSDSAITQVMMNSL